MKSQINGPKINFLFDSSQIQNGTNKILNNYETWYTELRQKKFTSKQDFFNYYLQTESWDVELETYDFMQHVHPDEDIRKSAVETSKKVSDFFNKWLLDEDIYNTILEFNKSYHSTLNTEEKKYIEYMIFHFKHNGIHLNKKIRNKLEKINNQLSKLSIEYSNNLNELKDCLYVSFDELNGINNDFIISLEKNDNDKYKLTTQYDIISEIMTYCTNEETRKKVSQMFLLRGKEPCQNHKLLQETIGLRKEKVSLLGFPTYADYTLSNKRMATSSKQVLEFLHDLVNKIKERSEYDSKELAEYFDKKEMDSWNYAYYSNLYQKEVLQLNQKEIQDFFPLEKLLPNLLGTFEEIFHLKIEECSLSNEQIWHDSIKCYCVFDDENKKDIKVKKDIKSKKIKTKIENNETRTILGYFYIDLYPRDGKFGHAAAFTLKKSYIENGIRSIPISAMVCNFTRPMKDKPSLLTFNEVETFFHELGHIFHQLLSQNQLSAFSGTAVENDFVECPSQALENWCYEEDFLTRISNHYKTNKSMSNDLMIKIKKNKNLFNGLHYIRQLIFALYDMQLHSSLEYTDVEITFEEIQEKLSPFIHNKGCIPANFEHIMGGYQSGYYGYLWSEVYAAEVFQLFKKSGNIFNKEIGLHYRKCILEKGGTETGFTMMENLLGRKPTNKEFLKKFNS